MSEHYPLEAARELRGRAVEDAGEALANAVRAHAEAAQAHVATRARLEAHERETAELLAKERASGPRRVDDLQHAQAYLARRRTERLGWIEAVARAAAEEQAREKDVLAARDALATAKAEAEAVEKHHTRWQDERRRRAEQRADEEVEDLVTARHGRER
jgi:flagellar biosynthesis chaperone FliJ